MDWSVKKVGKKKSKSVNLQLFEDDLLIKREINTLLLPLFRTGKEEREWEREYNIDFGERKGLFRVSGSWSLGIPTEFDYKVFLAVLEIHAEQGYRDIDMHVADVIRRLGLSDGGKNTRSIRDAIDRLVSTTYTAQGVFAKKHENGEAEFEQEVKFHLLESTRRTTEVWMETNTKFQLRLSSVILENIQNKHFRFFNARVLGELGRWGIKRFYEIIEFQRNGRNVNEYKYATLAAMIPLNSGRMSKRYIVGYAEKLKEQGFIKDFVANKMTIKIWFFDDQKNQKKLTVIEKLEEARNTARNMMKAFDTYYAQLRTDELKKLSEQDVLDLKRKLWEERKDTLVAKSTENPDNPNHPANWMPVAKASFISWFMRMRGFELEKERFQWFADRNYRLDENAWDFYAYQIS